MSPVSTSLAELKSRLSTDQWRQAVPKSPKTETCEHVHITSLPGRTMLSYVYMCNCICPYMSICSHASMSMFACVYDSASVFLTDNVPKIMYV